MGTPAPPRHWSREPRPRAGVLFCGPRMVNPRFDGSISALATTCNSMICDWFRAGLMLSPLATARSQPQCVARQAEFSVPYQLRWEPHGVYSRYFGNVTGGDMRRHIEEVCKDDRFEQHRSSRGRTSGQLQSDSIRSACLLTRRGSFRPSLMRGSGLRNPVSLHEDTALRSALDLTDQL